MNQLLEVNGHEKDMKSVVIIEAGRFAGAGHSLPESFGEGSQLVADLLERRLSRLENALGLDPIN